ncbi:MAG: alpha/beta fold hydrolase [Phycicoccus sp.]
MIETGEVRLWCRDTGGDQPAVLLLHGLAGHAGEWQATATALAATHRVVAFDQRGHGRSIHHPRDLSRAAFVADVARLAARLGLGPLTLVGQSMGAHTAMLTAAAHPEMVRRLVLVEGGVGGGGPTATETVAGLLRGWPVPFPDLAAAGEYFGGGTVGRAWAAGLREEDGGWWPRFDVDVMVAAVSSVHARARWDAWRRVRQSSLLVLGERGTVSASKAEQMLATNAGATLETVADAGHDVHLESPERWVALLREFLDP